MECYERGILTEADTGGLALRWGDGETVSRLIEMIARREGFGDLLAEGSYRASCRLGRDSERYVVHVKGMEIAMHDPRAMEPMLKNYPVNPTGGDHTGGATHRTALRNSAGVCNFLQYGDPVMVDVIRGVTGWDVTQEELEMVTRRGLAMARLFNLREGMTAADDRLPPRLHESHPSGPLADRRLTEERVAEIVRDYYRAQGWDETTGVPTAATLSSLGVAEYASA
jgi:aldehyde:ferredoxin oxidoreductase